MTAKFIVSAGPAGLVQCNINGEDVLSLVAGVQVNVTDGQLTEVFLRKDPGATGTIEGEGIVYVHGDDPGPAVREFLATVDTEQLESEIMNEAEWGDEGSTVAAVLNKLIERSREA